MNPAAGTDFTKKVEKLPDGRYLIYYDFKATESVGSPPSGKTGEAKEGK